jgi:hypothetical protein
MTIENDTLPIDLSRDSKRNAFAHRCEKVAAFKNYAVCLHLMNERKNGALPVTYSECSAAIGNKSCPAIKMRKEEAEKGHAIYFVERVRSEATYMEAGDFKEVTVSDYKRKRKSPVTKSEPVSAKPKSAADMFLSGGAGIADAINEAVKNESKPIKDGSSERAVADAKPKAPEVKVTNVQGESLAEMAMRIMKERKQKEAVSV